VHALSLTAPAVVALATALALFLLRHLAFRVLRGYARVSKTKIDEFVIGSLRAPSVFWCVAIGLHVGLSMSDLPDKYTLYLSKAIDIIVILSISIAVANASGRMLENYIRTSNIPIPPTGLVYGSLKGIIFLVGLLFILHVLGISILPLITTLGIGGLAIALALQDTLANLFSGIQMLMEKSIRVGDHIRLEKGEEGYVEDITWRSARIRVASNNVVIVPNSQLAKSVVTNYSLPDRKMTISVRVPVSFDADPDEAERMLLEEADRAIGEVPGLLAEPAPLVRFSPGFGEGVLEFSVICQVESFSSQDIVQHELRKRMFKRLKREGLAASLPSRTPYAREGKN
jgi:small-conductance mechanosensitive channel